MRNINRLVQDLNSVRNVYSKDGNATIIYVENGIIDSS